MSPERKADKPAPEQKKSRYRIVKRNYGQEDLDKLDPELFNVVEAPKTKSRYKIKIRDYTDENFPQLPKDQ